MCKSRNDWDSGCEPNEPLIRAGKAPSNPMPSVFLPESGKARGQSQEDNRERRLCWAWEWGWDGQQWVAGDFNNQRFL